MQFTRAVKQACISEYAPDIACDKIHFFDQN